MDWRWALGMLLSCLIGCTRATPSEPCQADSQEVRECPAPPPPPACPKADPAPTQIEMIDLRNKCFESLQEREKALEELRNQIEYLKSSLQRAQAEAEDWRNQFYQARQSYSCPE